jgi:hypothetical protein
MERGQGPAQARQSHAGVGVGVNDRVGCWKGAKDGYVHVPFARGRAIADHGAVRVEAHEPLRRQIAGVRSGRRDQRALARPQTDVTAAAVIESLVLQTPDDIEDRLPFRVIAHSRFSHGSVRSMDSSVGRNMSKGPNFPDLRLSATSSSCSVVARATPGPL